MPQTTNLKSVDPGINPACQSVTGWFLPRFEQYPQPPAPFTPVQAEVLPAAAHCVIFEAFGGKNATGASLGRGSIQTGPTCLQLFQATDVESLLVAAFPAPGPN